MIPPILELAALGALVLSPFTLTRRVDADRPDFSGRWELDSTLSDFAGGPAPARRVDAIIHKDPSLTIERFVTLASGAGLVQHYDLVVDGREHLNVVGGIEIRSVLEWDQDELVVRSTQRGPGGDVTAVDRWRLSAERDRLTIERRFTAGGHETIQKLVFRRIP